MNENAARERIVLQALLVELNLNDGHVGITAKTGVVLLRGTVHSTNQQMLAE